MKNKKIQITVSLDKESLDKIKYLVNEKKYDSVPNFIRMATWEQIKKLEPILPIVRY